MYYNEAQKLLAKLGEESLLEGWKRLHPNEQEALLTAIRGINPSMLQLQQELVHKTPGNHSSLKPFTEYFSAGNVQDTTLGKKLIAEGKVGCLLIAGGQGTRLKIDGPKGLYPISPVKHKSLFQLFAEKTLAAGVQAGRPLPLAIMTSPQNHRETIDFFGKHNNFGLAAEQVSFFSQEELPFLNHEGHLFLETPSTIAHGPDGNGSSLQAFYAKGPGKAWKEGGIEYVNYVLIDNPLADPFDAELIGHHSRNKNEVTIKCVHKNDPEEKVGVLGYLSDKLAVVEYSELPEKERVGRNPDGTLAYNCANISLFCFSMNFIEKISHIPFHQFPLHKAFKAAKYLATDGKTHQSDKPIAWKFERYIFDLLPYAIKVTALLYPRESSFAPLKNNTGNDSPETVKAALSAYDKKTIEALTGFKPTSEPFELDQQFHYPTHKWKGKQPTGSYLEWTEGTEGT